MISALLDNYIYQHQEEGFALKEIIWKRVLDVNDRSLRNIVTGLGPRTNGLTAESGFDITPASEIIAAAFKWSISNEKWMDGTNSWLDLLKVRASYGVTGNNRIGNYDYLAQMVTGNTNYFFKILL